MDLLLGHAQTIGVHSRAACPLLRLRAPVARSCPAPCTRPANKVKRRQAVIFAGSATEQDTSEQSFNSSTDGAFEGRESYMPASYSELVGDAARAVGTAVDDGVRRLEVDFPPLTNTGLGTNFRGSDEFIDTNVQLAISAANKLREGTSKRVHILVPDKIEYRRSYKLFKNALERTEGRVTLGYLQESKPAGFLANINPFAGQTSTVPPSESAKEADIFLATNLVSVDLPLLEQYMDQYIKDQPIVLWNLELDTLRSDLGLIGFPKKDLQYRFLCSFKPVFYIRPREYSKSISAPPFIVNYNGALFRQYPGPWQCMLREPNGVLASIAERKERFDLGELKEELGIAMGLNTEAPGSALAFFRKGFRTTTWWEDARDKEKYGDWRT